MLKFCSSAFWIIPFDWLPTTKLPRMLPGILEDQKLNFHRKIEIKNIKQVISIDDIDNFKNCFQILSFEKSVSILTETEEEKMCWINLINEAKQNLIESKSTLKT
ncbi:hypothetical protein HK099_006487, partial [Clydaea vesicula]